MGRVNRLFRDTKKKYLTVEKTTITRRYQEIVLSRDAFISLKSPTHEIEFTTHVDDDVFSRYFVRRLIARRSHTGVHTQGVSNKFKDRTNERVKREARSISPLQTPRAMLVAWHVNIDDTAISLDHFLRWIRFALIKTFINAYGFNRDRTFHSNRVTDETKTFLSSSTSNHIPVATLNPRGNEPSTRISSDGDTDLLTNRAHFRLFAPKIVMTRRGFFAF